MRAVQFDQFGGVDVLEVREVPRPVPGGREVLVDVRAAGINPGEVSIREGRLEGRFPTTFPCGEGTDLAGVVAALGPQVDGFAVGDEVCGWTERRASHAESVVVPTDQLTAKPPDVSWEVAGSLFVASMAAYACVETVGVAPGDVVVVSAAAGGVGSFAVQLAALRGATVIGLASERNHEWLAAHGVRPVRYGEGQAERIVTASNGRVDAFIDTYGGGYVDLAIELGVPKERINTIIDFAAVERLGVSGAGTHQIATAERLAEVLELVAAGRLDVPIARTYPLAEVRDAFRDLEQRTTHGKIVLVP
jgi:NADPH:quinone reductase-like Zn-dependent oxidoreductase